MTLKEWWAQRYPHGIWNHLTAAFWFWVEWWRLAPWQREAVHSLAFTLGTMEPEEADKVPCWHYDAHFDKDGGGIGFLKGCDENGDPLPKSWQFGEQGNTTGSTGGGASVTVVAP